MAAPFVGFEHYSAIPGVLCFRGKGKLVYQAGADIRRGMHMNITDARQNRINRLGLVVRRGQGVIQSHSAGQKRRTCDNTGANPGGFD